jgi:hypothetical protein
MHELGPLDEILRLSPLYRLSFMIEDEAMSKSFEDRLYATQPVRP